MFDELKNNETKQDNLAENSGPQWIIGVVLIAVGGVVMVGQTTGIALQNWWALFMLIPGLFFLNRLWQEYRQYGRITPAGRGALIGGLATLVIPAFFLFNLNWGLLWPVMLIIGGLTMVFHNK